MATEAQQQAERRRRAASSWLVFEKKTLYDMSGDQPPTSGEHEIDGVPTEAWVQLPTPFVAATRKAAVILAAESVTFKPGQRRVFVAVGQDDFVPSPPVGVKPAKPTLDWGEGDAE